MHVVIFQIASGKFHLAFCLCSYIIYLLPDFLLVIIIIIFKLLMQCTNFIKSIIPIVLVNSAVQLKRKFSIFGMR